MTTESHPFVRSAASPPPPFDPAKIDPDKEYDVIVAKPVSVDAAHLRPRDYHRMTGAFLALIVKEFGADVVYAAAIRV